jgi:hypothetical protein
MASREAAQENTSERLHSFAEACQLMRNEGTPRTERVPLEDVHKLLFT